MKNLLRRALAMTLTISMVTSMIGILPAFAANTDDQIDGESTPIYYEVDEETTSKTTEGVDASTLDYKTEMKSVEEGAVQVAKTIAGTNNPNEFVVTLRVETTEDVQNLNLSSDAAVVLVIDNSSSMYQSVSDTNDSSAPLMKEAFKWNPATNKNESTGFAVEPDSVNPDYLTYVNASSASTIPYIKNGRIPTTSNAKENWRITQAKEAATTFATDFMTATGVRKIAVVSYSTDAKLETGWTTDVAVATTAIDKMRPINMTYMAPGLNEANTLLNQADVQNIPNKYVILLADGEASDKNSAHVTAASTVDGRADTKLYKVSFASSDKMTGLAGASYTSADLDALCEALADIDKEITTAADAWTVTDPMGQYITYVTDSFTGTSISEGVPGHNKVYPTTDNTSFKWDLKESDPVETTHNRKTTYTYTLSYTITLNTGAQFFKEDTYYLTNGQTTLDYSVTTSTTVGGESTETYKNGSVDFDVPAVEGTIPEMGYIVKHYLQTAEKDSEDAYIYDYQTGDDVVYPDVDKWTVLDESVVESYAKEYHNYTFDTSMGAAAGDVTIIIDGQELKLYYNLIPTKVIVNHYYYDVEMTEGGKSYIPNTGKNDSRTDDDCYIGDQYPASASALSGYNFAYGDTGAGISDTYAGEENTASTQTLILEAKETGANIINFYYISDTTEETRERTVSIQHVYKDEYYDYDLATGRYTIKTSTSDPTEPVVTTVLYGEAYNGVMIPNGYTYDDNDFSGNTVAFDATAGENGTVTIDNVTTNTTITVYYLKEVTPKAPVTVTVEHIYQVDKSYVDVDGQLITNYVTDTIETDDTFAGSPYYAGERFSTTADPTPEHATYAGYDYTCKTADADMEIDPLTDDENKITIYYLRDGNVETDVTVKHWYTWNEEYVTEEGEVDVRYHTGFDTTDLGDEIFYVDDYFTAQPIELFEGKTYSISADSPERSRQLVLDEKENVFNIYYELNTYLTEDASVEVTHTYKTYEKAYTAQGQLYEKLIDTVTDPTTIPYTGKDGEKYTADEAYTYDDVTYTSREDNETLTTRLVSGETKKIDLVYKIVEDNREDASVTVYHNYYDRITAIVDGEIKTYDVEVADTAYDTGLMSGYYEGENFTATKIPNEYTFDASKSDNTSLILEAGDDNAIHLYYYAPQNILGETITVQVIHEYTTKTTTVVNGEVTYNETTSTEPEDVQTGKYVGQNFIATPITKDFARTSDDASLSTTLIDGENIITITYEKTNPLPEIATLDVVHNYTVKYTNGDEDLVLDPVSTPRVSTYAGVTLGFASIEDYIGYTFDLVDLSINSEDADNATRTVTLDAGSNLVEIDYVYTVENREIANVVVNHFYSVKDLMDGSITEENRDTDNKYQVRYIDGDIFTATLQRSYEGYNYPSYTGDLTLELNHNEAPFVINLYYLREVDNTPTTPDEPDEPDVPTTPDKPTPPNILTKYYSLTVKWVDEDGHALADKDYSPHLRTGTMYDTTKKSFEGYHFIGMQAGSDPASGVVRSDKYVTYVYAPDDVPEVPEIPDVPEIPEIPETDIPLTDIPDLEVPLEDIPTVDVPLVDVPLTDIPQTGDNRNLAFLASTALFSALGLVALVKSEMNDKKKRSEG